MDRRRAAGAAGALLALAACFAYSAAAPTTSDHTGLDLYNGSEGCYYNFQYYGEGDRIMTNEPCLNCTCHNRMLMCYLRVCPFTKPIGQDCTIEKRADQCCPIVTCPDVPVDLLTSTSTSSPAEYGATGLGKVDKYGCSINGRYFSEGSKVPSTPNKPCEHCYCIRNMTTCVMQECTLHVDGCTPIYHKDVCCPVRYSCDHAEDEIPLLDDMTTTVRPTPGFILTTTTLSSVTQMTQDCVHDDHIFSDGALIKTEKACEHCYCMKGDIVCVVQECGTPMENEGKNCTALPPREGQCCPDTYICEGDGIPTEVTETSAPSHEFITPYYEVEDIEGSGTEPNEKPITDMPIWLPDVEYSGDNEPITIHTEVNKPPAPTEELTTEPDKSLNTVPHLPDEEFPETEYKATTHIEESKISESTTLSHKEPESTTEPIITTSTLRASSKSKEEDNIVTTEKTFRRDDEGTLGIKITTQKNLESEGTTLSSELSTEPIKTYPEQKYNLTVQESEHLPEVTSEYSKESVTEAVTETLTSSPETNEGATDLSPEKPLDVSTTQSSPSRIPGEGDCLYNGKTFNNNSIVPSENNCQINCLCVSSIIKCENVICSSPPDLIDNCQPIYDSPDSCCPTYVCPPKETVPPQAHNQMAGTQSPVLKPSPECSGDLNCEVKEQTIPAEECSTGSCSSPPETCGDSKCASDENIKQGSSSSDNIEPIVEQECSKKEDCEQAQLPGDNISQCVGDSCLTPEKSQPTSQDCKDEKCEIETQCKDESCRRKATPTEIKESSCTESSCSVPIPSISQATTEEAVLETKPISSTEKMHIHDVLPDTQENFTDEPEIQTEYPGVYPTEISGGSIYEPQTKPNELEKVTATILSENETELDTKIPITSLPETLGANTEKLPIMTTDASLFPANRYGNKEKPLPTTDDQKMITTERLLSITTEQPKTETEENTSLIQESPTSVPKIQTYAPEAETITKIPEVSITASEPLGTISPENPTIETQNLTEEPGSKTSEAEVVTKIPMITTLPLNKDTATFDTEKQPVTTEYETTQSTVPESAIEQQVTMEQQPVTIEQEPITIEQQPITIEPQSLTTAQEISSKVPDQSTEQKTETTAEESSSKVPELSNEQESVATVAESTTKVPEVDTAHQLVTAEEESSSKVPEPVTEQQSATTAGESSSKIPEVTTKQQSVTIAETSSSIVPELIAVTSSSEEPAESTKFTISMPEGQTVFNEIPPIEHTTKEPREPQEVPTTVETMTISEEETINISPEKHTINPEEQFTKSVEATTTEKQESSSLKPIDVISLEQAVSKSTTEETINVSTENDSRIKTTNTLFTVTQPTSESTERLPVITEQTGTIATESSIFVKETVSKTPEQLDTITQPEQLTSQSTERLPITTENIESITTESSTFFKEITSKSPEQLETLTESQETQPQQPISQTTEQPLITEETGGKTTDKLDIVTPPEELTSISTENLPIVTEQTEYITTESITPLKEITSKSPERLETVTKSQEAQSEQPIIETTEYQPFTTKQTVITTTGKLDIVTQSEQLTSESTERLPITIEQTESITSESSTYFKEITTKSPELLDTETQAPEQQTEQPNSQETENAPITKEPTVISSTESIFKETSSKLPAEEVGDTQISEGQLSTSGEETSTKAIVHETSAPEQTTSQPHEFLITDTNLPEEIPTVTQFLPEKAITDKPVTAATDEVLATAMELQTTSPVTQEFITDKHQTISSEEPERKATEVFVTTTENINIITEPQIVMKPDEEKLVTSGEDTSKLPEAVTATETPKNIAQELPITKKPEADITVSELLPTTIIEESTSETIETILPVTEKKDIIRPGESLSKAPETTKQEEPFTTHGHITTSSDEAVDVAAVTDRLSSTTVKSVTQPFEESTMAAVTQDKEVIPIGPDIKSEKPTLATEIQEDVSKIVVTEAPENLSSKVTATLISEEPQTKTSEDVSAVVTKATSFDEIVTRKPELEVSTLPTLAEISSKSPEEEEVTETGEKLSSVELTSNTPESFITVKDEQAATFTETSSKIPQELATSTETQKDITPEISTNKEPEYVVEISSKPPEDFATISQTQETVKDFEPTTKVPELFVTVTDEKVVDLAETSSQLPETQTTVELTEKSTISEEIISEVPEEIVTATEKIATTQKFKEFATTVKQEKSSEAPVSATTVTEGTNTDNLETHVTDTFEETKPPSFPEDTIEKTTSTEKSISEIPQAYPITTEKPSSEAVEYITPENEKLPSTSEVYTSNKIPEEQVTISWTQETNTIEEKPSETPILKETEKQHETTVGKVPDSEPSIIQTTESLPSSSEVSTLLVESSQKTKEQTTVTEANKVIMHEEETTSKISPETVSVASSTEELEPVTVSISEQQTISFSVETSSKLPEQVVTTTETQFTKKDMTTQEVTFVEETSSQAPELQVTISRAELTTSVPSVTNTEQAVTTVEQTSSKETENPHALISQEPFDVSKATTTSSEELSSQIPEEKVTIPSTILGESVTTIGDEIISSDNKQPVSTSIPQDKVVTEAHAPITENNPVQVTTTAEPTKSTILDISSTSPETQELVTVANESGIPPKEVTKPENVKIGPTILQESAVTEPGVESSSEYSIQPEQYPTGVPTTIQTNDVVTQIPVVSSSTMYESETAITSSDSQESGKPGEADNQTELTPYIEVSTPHDKYDTLSTETIPHKVTKEPIIEESQKTTVPTELGKPLFEEEPNNITEVQKERPLQEGLEGSIYAEKPVLDIQGHPIEEHVPTHEPTMPEEELIPVTTSKTTTTTKTDEKPPTLPSIETFTKPDEKPSELHPTSATPEPTEEIPASEEPSSAPHGYGQEPDYGEDEQPFGPGTCRYGGKVYVSAQQIPRDDPCDFCFCFRSDIICLQQSCPPPIHGCHEEPIQGFCCPRYECPVSMATSLNITTTTTTTTTTLPPHFLSHAYKGAAQKKGCQIKGHVYKVGEVIRASSGPCLHCTCGGDGQMKCDPKACTPEPMLRQMIAAAVSSKRRR